MLWPLAGLTLLLSAADHWTTYLCLRQPVPGWQIDEANPISQWLFEAVGLVPGLILDSGITLAALAFLVTTRHVPGALKTASLAVIAFSTGYAVLNNFAAIETLGLSPFGLF